MLYAELYAIPPGQPIAYIQFSGYFSVILRFMTIAEICRIRAWANRNIMVSDPFFRVCVCVSSSHF